MDDEPLEFCRSATGWLAMAFLPVLCTLGVAACAVAVLQRRGPDGLHDPRFLVLAAVLLLCAWKVRRGRGEAGNRLLLRGGILTISDGRSVCLADLCACRRVVDLGWGYHLYERDGAEVVVYPSSYAPSPTEVLEQRLAMVPRLLPPPADPSWLRRARRLPWASAGSYAAAVGLALVAETDAVLQHGGGRTPTDVVLLVAALACAVAGWLLYYSSKAYRSRRGWTDGTYLSVAVSGRVEHVAYRDVVRVTVGPTSAWVLPGSTVESGGRKLRYGLSDPGGLDLVEQLLHEVPQAEVRLVNGLVRWPSGVRELLERMVEHRHEPAPPTVEGGSA